MQHCAVTALRVSIDGLFFQKCLNTSFPAVIHSHYIPLSLISLKVRQSAPSNELLSTKATWKLVFIVLLVWGTMGTYFYHFRSRQISDVIYRPIPQSLSRPGASVSQPRGPRLHA